MKHIKPNDIIQAPYWKESVEVKFIEPLGERIHVLGVTIYSRQQVDVVLSEEEAEKINVIGNQTCFTEKGENAFLAVETMRYRYASLYDPLLAMHCSKVDPLPHQIEAVYGYILRKPRIRFLIADDPGAGKTIMAGLIIKELKIRHLAKRILIVVPGHLKDLWRRELKDRFEEIFLPIGRDYLDALYGQNVWMRENQIITSIDFAKREDVLSSLASVQFDLIIVDEAHKMSAYRYGEKIDKTIRYRLGETLSRITNHLLFLTATPHKGDPENFRLFLDLLEPGFFANENIIQESLKNKDNPLFIRRVKEDLRDFDGRPLFLPRHVITKPFKLGNSSPNEVNLYNNLSRYVVEQYNKALTKDKHRNIAFAIVILQRRFASSTYALLRSLERRKERLQAYLDSTQPIKRADTLEGWETIEDLSEEERWREEEIWETLSVAENVEELKKEIKTIEGLIAEAKKIIQNEEEIKLKEFKKALFELSSKYIDPKDKKILVFTESKDTLEYLAKKVANWGFSTNCIHGSMKLEDRIKAEGIFKNETQVLIATEAAGEGINLQFCHLMINYDIPWNPNRLEQRMGRIHRYGQDKEVYIYNLVAIDTYEGEVLYKLFEKLEEIRRAMGNDKVFDVLNEILFEKDLAQLLVDAATHARSREEILKELDIKVDEKLIAHLKDILGESLATRFIDYSAIKEMAQKAREYRLIPEYTERYFKKAWRAANGIYHERKDGFLAIDLLPYPIRQIADDDTFKKTFGQLLKRYPKITFDKEIAFSNQDAEFVTFGHPLFEAVMNYCEQQYRDVLLKGAILADPDGLLDGYILFYEGEIKDGTGAIAGKRLFAIYTDGKEIRPVQPSILWDLAEINMHCTDSCNIEHLKSLANKKVLDQLEDYRKEILIERNRQAEIKQKYGVKSLEHLIVQLDGELITLQSRQERGENVDLAIRNKQQRKNDYYKALQELENLIINEKNLTMSMPWFVGIIKVVPMPAAEPEMQSDPEIERIGMEVVMNFEKSQGRIPEDVSSQALGFDIRSHDPATGQIRYIEVKARAKTGAVALTQKEWMIAHRLQQDYFLYAIMEAASKPQLYIINHPTVNLQAQERIEMVRFWVPFGQIKAKAERFEAQ